MLLALVLGCGPSAPAARLVWHSQVLEEECADPGISGLSDGPWTGTDVVVATAMCCTHSGPDGEVVCSPDDVGIVDGTATTGCCDAGTTLTWATLATVPE